MGDLGPLLNWIGTEFDLNPMPIVQLPMMHRQGCGSQVRTRLPVGGNRIRTIGPAPAKGSSGRCQSETAARKAEPLTGSGPKRQCLPGVAAHSLSLRGGTASSNPSSSSGESSTNPSRHPRGGVQAARQRRRKAGRLPPTPRPADRSIRLARGRRTTRTGPALHDNPRSSSTESAKNQSQGVWRNEEICATPVGGAAE
jgi:hypothetical protein